MEARLTVFVHVYGVRTCRFCLGVWVYFTGSETADIVCTWASIADACKTEFLVLLCLCLVEELLVAFETLGGGSADNGGNCAPLCGHKLGEMKEFFIFSL
jgi:hypothetical protein